MFKNHPIKYRWVGISPKEKLFNRARKLIVILGPTATGKTKLAVKLANKYQGEIVSADSRQVYRGLDIGTGKDLGDYVVKSQKHKNTSASRRTQKQKIRYHLIDIVSPKTEFNVAEYQKLAYQAINNILSRHKIPFLVGGTGLYVDAVTKGYQFPSLTEKTQNAKPAYRPAGAKTQNLRKKLNKLTLPQLLARLKKIDSATYQIIDKKNRRRVQRALEIYFETGQTKSEQLGFQKPDYDILFLGVKFPLPEIYQKIDSRLLKRIEEGMINEVKELSKAGVSYQHLNDLGLEYRYLARYLKGEIDYQTLINDLKNAIHHLAKRQLTWFKRNKDIIWVRNYMAADQEIKRFLEK